MIQLATFILFDLSSERSFSAFLNKPLDKPVLTDIKNDINISYADFFFSVYHLSFLR